MRITEEQMSKNFAKEGELYPKYISKIQKAENLQIAKDKPKQVKKLEALINCKNRQGIVPMKKYVIRYSEYH